MKRLVQLIITVFLLSSQALAGPVEGPSNRTDNIERGIFTANAHPRGRFNAGLETFAYQGGYLVESGTCTAGAVSDYNTCASVAHNTNLGDIVRFTSGALAGIEARVVVDSTDYFDIGMTLDTATDGITYSTYRPISQTLSSTGGSLGTYAEDSAHTSGDVGQFMLAVRNNGAATTFTGANADYSPLACNGNGALYVEEQYTTRATEDAAETAGGLLTMIGSVRRDVPASSANTTGDNATLNTDARGALWVAGLAQEDFAPSSGDYYPAPLLFITDSPARTSSGANELSHFIGNGWGSQWVDVQGFTTRVCVAITPDTAAYAANDIVGGLQTFASLLRTGVNSGILQNIEITNTEIDGIPFNVCIFNANPSGSTVADQGPATIVAADLQKLIGCVSVADGRSFVTTELYQAQNVGLAVDAAATSLYAIVRTTGIPTWAAAQTLNVCLTVLND